MPYKQDRWAEVIQKLGLDISRPVNFVTAQQIHSTIHEEPRLMASMDSYEALPNFLRDAGVFVVPVANGRYALVHGAGYHALEDPGPPTRFAVRLPIPLLSLNYGSGESRFLMHAFHSGLISAFSRVDQIYPTFFGKRSSGSFDFHVNGSPELSVNGARIEIDQEFEGVDDVLLFEAKSVPHDSFLVRQLYYPYRTLKREIPSKAIRMFFFVAKPTANIYSIWEYDWVDPLDYETIRLRKAESFELDGGKPLTQAMLAIKPDPSLAKVPQADDLDKVSELPFLVSRGLAPTAKSWATYKGVDPRQGSYYREAAEALGLLQSRQGRFELTAEGSRFVTMPPDRRDEVLALRLMSNPALNKAFHLILSRHVAGVTDADLAEVVRESSHLGGATLLRRAKTLRSYLTWLGRTTGSLVVKSRRIYSREAWDQMDLESHSAGASNP